MSISCTQRINISVPVCVAKAHLITHAMFKLSTLSQRLIKLSIVLLQVSIVETWRSQVKIRSLLTIRVLIFIDICYLSSPSFLREASLAVRSYVSSCLGHLLGDLSGNFDNALFATTSLILK